MRWIGLVCLVVCLLSGVGHAVAQGLPETLNPQNLVPTLTGPASAKIIQYVVLISILSVAPGIIVMVTSFTRIVIALSFLRSGIGLQTTPANLVMVSLALFLTMFVMAPTLDRAWQEGFKPYADGQITDIQAYDRITDPFRDFMLNNVREKELALFQELATETAFKQDVSERDLRILVPAFLISELRRGFEIGFLIALPFLIIDLVVATVTMSMGMMMLPPTVISLPFKVLFFVLVDGWTLLVESLVKSFN
jgi:flagellar biosynthesis protein FliP